MSCTTENTICSESARLAGRVRRCQAGWQPDPPCLVCLLRAGAGSSWPGQGRLSWACPGEAAWLAQVEKAVDDGYDVRSFMGWTLIDNFEVWCRPSCPACLLQLVLAAMRHRALRSLALPSWPLLHRSER